MVGIVSRGDKSKVPGNKIFQYDVDQWVILQLLIYQQ